MNQALLKKRVSRLLLGAITCALISASSATAEYAQATSAATLSAAEGLIHDVSQLDPEPHWTFNGAWRLRCSQGPCSQVPLEGVDFDLTLIMVQPDGGLSHAHAFSEFVATAVSVDGDNLSIDGTIVGSGAVGGPTAVSIDLISVGEVGEMRLFFPDNPHILDLLGGVAVRSRD